MEEKKNGRTLPSKFLAEALRPDYEMHKAAGKKWGLREVPAHHPLTPPHPLPPPVPPSPPLAPNHHTIMLATIR